MVVYHRWMILPLESYTEEGEEVRKPKYVGDPSEDRLDGFQSAGPFHRPHVQGAGYNHLLAHNNAQEWRVVVAWGEGNTAWQALNEIHANNHDTETLADHNKDVKPVLDSRFGEGNWKVDKLPDRVSENAA